MENLVVLYGNRRWVDIEQCDKQEIVVVCPLASMEQHGHHLPLLTDTYLVSGVAERVHKRLADRILLTPTLWLGASDHHLDFPGTLSVSNTLYTEIIKNLVRSFVRAGFRRIFFLNGHGGNVTPGVNAITEMANDCDDCDSALLALASYWSIAAPVMKAEHHGMKSPQLTHACEYETSMMLHLHGELVQMHLAKGTPQVPGKFGDRANIAGRFCRRSTTGAMDHPEHATAEKGESLLNAISGEVTAFIEEFAAMPTRDVLGPVLPA